jgi:5,10-methylene-tetrahydrofolate dehydrogenase/methenyl tetrahydrofolate cyclohydrolase
VLPQRLHHLRHGGGLLPDGDVDAEDVRVLLVDESVSTAIARLPLLAIADDELALTAAEGHHRVDGLQPGLQRLLDRLPSDDPRRP